MDPDMQSERNHSSVIAEHDEEQSDLSRGSVSSDNSHSSVTEMQHGHLSQAPEGDSSDPVKTHDRNDITSKQSKQSKPHGVCAPCRKSVRELEHEKAAHQLAKLRNREMRDRARRAERRVEVMQRRITELEVMEHRIAELEVMGRQMADLEAANVRRQQRQARRVRVDEEGDLIVRVGERELLMTLGRIAISFTFWYIVNMLTHWLDGVFGRWIVSLLAG